MRVKLGVGGLVVALGLSAAACGGGGASRVSVGPNLLASAYNSAMATKSADVDMHMTVTPATGTARTMHVTGVWRWKPVLASLTETMGTSAGSMTVSSRVVGGNMYIELPAQYRAAMGGKPWLEASLAALTGNSLDEFDPTQILSLLAGHASSVTRVGSDTVGGVATTHYRAVRDLSASSSTPAAGPAMGKLAAMLGTTKLPVDVWIDSAGRLVQTKTNLTLEHAPQGASPVEAAAFPTTEVITETLSDYGVPVTVIAPPPDQVSPIDLTKILHGEGL